MDASPPASLPPDSLDEKLFHGQHRALIRAILSNISEGVSIVDISGNAIYFNPFVEKVFGPGSYEPVPAEWSARYGVFRPDEQTVFPSEELPLVRALMQREEVRNVDIFVRNAHIPEGVHLRASCAPVRDEQGRQLGAMSLVRDIGKQRQVEADKLRTEQQFRLLVETAQEGVWTVDAEYRTTYVNRYMAQMLGYSVEEMLGMHLFSFMDEESRQGVSARMTHDRENRTGGRVRDFKYLRKDGTPIWTSVSASPSYDEQGRYVGALIMVTDVTERRAAEEQVRQLNEELEQRIAERTAQLEFANRELEAFAYSVAHDLRAPLRSVFSFSEALAEDCAERLDEMGLDYLRRIRAAARRMSELIDGLLSLSRVNRTELAMGACNLSALARSISEQLQALQPERSVRVSIQEGLADRGDSQLLRAVLENLLGNAWKFTRERPVAEIEFGARQEAGGRRTYFVRDNGAGFDMAYRNKLFGVFQRLHTQAEFEGNGVGLATVQRIIRRHGGRIWGEGEVGRGACFFFTLNESPLPPGMAFLAREK